MHPVVTEALAYQLVRGGHLAALAGGRDGQSAVSTLFTLNPTGPTSDGQSSVLLTPVKLSEVCWDYIPAASESLKRGLVTVTKIARVIRS